MKKILIVSFLVLSIFSQPCFAQKSRTSLVKTLCLGALVVAANLNGQVAAQQNTHGLMSLNFNLSPVTSITDVNVKEPVYTSLETIEDSYDNRLEDLLTNVVDTVCPDFIDENQACPTFKECAQLILKKVWRCVSRSES